MVHGGLEFSEPVKLNAEVIVNLEKFVPLAPLHQPHNLAPIRLVAERLPQVLQVACFDTAFHRAQPEIAQAFALPASITDRGVRRYGFHGLSYEYIASAFPRLDAAAAAGRVIVAHLGNGASLCAMKAGKSVASTMGFTAVDGLPMGTRCGSIDPGVMLYLMDELKMDARAIEKLIYQQSGLLGVSGHLERHARAAGEPRAAREARGGSLHLSHRPRTGLARRSARRSRCARVHGGHRRARRRRSASAYAATPPGSACSWTKRRTPKAGRASALPAAACRPGSSRPTKS